MGYFRPLLNWYARLTPGRNRLHPPYKHITQIGDPVLRKISNPVDVNLIKTEEIQTVIEQMKFVLNKYGCVGISAPQIGVNLRIIAIQYTRKHTTGLTNDYLQKRQISLVPLTFYINPTLKVLDYTKVKHTEGCESVKGFEADVARYQAIEVSGFNENAETITNQYEGWPARITQHEMDHLDGKLYTDIMDRTSLQCVCWEEVNLSRGKVVMPFTPS